MKAARLATLKFFALLFLLVGLAGLIASAAISTHYLVVMPRAPAPGPTPDEYRSVPRSIHGVTIYQTAKENRLLNTWEFHAVLVSGTYFSCRRCIERGLSGEVGQYASAGGRGRGARICGRSTVRG